MCCVALSRRCPAAPSSDGRHGRDIDERAGSTDRRCLRREHLHARKPGGLDQHLDDHPQHHGRNHPAAPQLRRDHLHQGHVATAEANGTYPQVFNNDGIDASFGVTSADLDRRDHDSRHPGQSGRGSQQFDVRRHVGQRPDDHELFVEVGAGAERSTDNQDVDFMGYSAQSGGIDVSNADTPGAIEPPTPTARHPYRAIAQLDQYGNIQFTETNAYSGNNGRAAILNPPPTPSTRRGTPATAPSPNPGRRRGTGSQILAEQRARVGQSPGTTTPWELQHRPDRCTQPTRPPRTPTSAASPSPTTSST